MKLVTREEKRLRRRVRSRSRIAGTATMPRLCVFRSLRGTSAQLVDDTMGKVIASVNSKKDTEASIDVGERKGKVAVAYALGKKLAEKALAQKIQTIVFDRSGYAYHGRVKALADGARDGGLQF